MWNKWFRSQEFLNQFVWKGKSEPIRTPLLFWGGSRQDFFTIILQRMILGAESYVPAAVWCELGNCGRLTSELNKAIRNPFSIKTNRRGTAERYYNLVPALLDPKYALDQANPALWEDVHEFYKTVRNKILHGYQIGNDRPEVLYPTLDLFNAVYDWVHSWHDIPTFQWRRNRSPGAATSSGTWVPPAYSKTR
jgi:hypothetical protein